MKPARLLLIIVGVIILTGVVAGALAMTPVMQRWALLRAANARPGLKLEAAVVSVGFTHVSLRGLQVDLNGLKVKLDRLETDYSLAQLLFSHRLKIDRLAAAGVMIDASRLSRAKAGATAAGAPAAAPSVLAQLELPFELVLEDCHVEGRALLPGPTGKPPVPADFKITGGRFAAGQEGSLRLTATITNPAADARVAALNAQISLRATQTVQHGFSRVALTAVVDAEGRNISDQSQLRISAGLEKVTAGEDYSVSVDTLLHGTAENMLALHAGLTADGKQYKGNWTLKARAAQLEPFFLGGALPDFSAHGEGLFAFTPATRTMALQGRLDADVSRLEKVEPAWRAFGAGRLQTQFDLAETDGIVRLHQLEVRLDGEHPVLELHATKAAEFNFKERRLQVGGSASGEILHFQLHGLPLAWVRPFIQAADISGGMITGGFTVTAEQNRLLLRAVQPLRVEQLTIVRQGELLLAKADVSLSAEAVLMAQGIRADISGLTLHTPAGDSLTVQSSIAVPLVLDRPYEVNARYDADLPSLLAPWLPLGPVKAAGETEFAFTGGKIELRRFKAGVTNAGGVALFKAEALRPFSLDLATRQATTGPSSGPRADGSSAASPEPSRRVDLMHLALGRLPLEHLRLNQPGTSLGGRVEQGEFVLAADGDKLTLHAVSPFKMAGVSLAQDGQPALTGLVIEALPAFELAGRSAGSGETGEATVRDASGAALLTFKAGVNQSPATGLRGTLAFNLDLPALFSQPLFAHAQAVSQGHASGEIRLALGGTRQVEARLTVNGLVARESGQTLPVANLSFRGVAQDNGKISVQAPLLLDRAGQRSDLNFSLELTPAGRSYGLDGRLTGEHVELADALAVLGVFLASAAEADKPATTSTQTTGPVNVTADRVPAWSRFNGQLLLDIKSATLGKNWAMTGLTGLMVINPAQVSLQKLEAAFGEKGRLSARGGLNFTADPHPYQLTGDFSLTEFDAGKLFKAIEPAKPATIEGRFTVSGHVDSRGATMEQTVAQSRGRFELASGQGVFRGLQRTTGRVSMTSKAVELGASVLGSLLGTNKGTRVAEKVAGQAYFVDQLAQSVGELSYDQLNVRLVRDETLNVTLEDFRLVSSEIRLSGKGTVTYLAGKPLLEQPLDASLAFAGRGKIEQLLGKLHLLDGTRDELDYARTQLPVTVGGTLARPDPSAFFTKIATAKLTELLTPDN
jgi:hypothetical protein